jgi:hypothetical protein
MSERLPLVLDDAGQMQRLQPGDTLPVTIDDRVDFLERKLATLIEALALNGLELPNEIL